MGDKEGVKERECADWQEVPCSLWTGAVQAAARRELETRGFCCQQDNLSSRQPTGKKVYNHSHPVLLSLLSLSPSSLFISLSLSLSLSLTHTHTHSLPSLPPTLPAVAVSLSLSLPNNLGCCWNHWMGVVRVCGYPVSLWSVCVC